MTTDERAAEPQRPMPAGRVVHVSREPYDIYIGRAMPRRRLAASPWANPFRIGPDGDRDAVIARYEGYLRNRPDLMARLPELEGKVLACWCAPEPCHGDVLLRLLAERRHEGER